MTNLNWGHRAVLVLITALVLTSVPASFARIADSHEPSQTAPQGRPQLPYRSQAKTQATGETMITVSLVRNSGEVIEATEADGGMIRVEFDDQAYGLTPLFKSNSDTIDLAIFKVDRVSSGANLVGERITQMETIRGVSSAPQYATTVTLPFGIQLDSVVQRHPRKASAVSPESSGPGQLGGHCCVTCDGFTTCACGVRASCGSCCSDPCCG